MPDWMVWITVLTAPSSESKAQVADTIDSGRVESEAVETIDHLGIGEHSERRGVEPMLGGDRGLLRREQTHPGRLRKARCHGFSGRRHGGETRRARRTRDGERYQLSGAGLLRGGGESDHTRIDVARYQVLQQRAAAAIGDMGNAGLARGPQQQFAREMLGTREPRDSDSQGARPRFRGGNVVFDRLDAGARVGEDALRSGDGEGDRRECRPQRRCPRDRQRLGGRKGVVGQEKGVAVRLRARRRLRSDATGPATDVLDHDRLAELGTERHLDDAGEGVHPSTGWPRDDEPQRTRRKRLLGI